MFHIVRCRKLAYVWLKPLGINAGGRSTVRASPYSTSHCAAQQSSEHEVKRNPGLSVVYTRKLPSTEHQYIKIYGPDTIKFLNGLCTSKLVPTFIKKNLTTISVAPEAQDDDAQMKPSSTVNAERESFLKKHSLYDELNSMYGNTLGMHSCFLSSQGRLLTDCIFYTPFVTGDAFQSNKLSKVTGHKYSEVVLGLPFLGEPFKQDLIKVMNGHKILSKVKIKDLSDEYFDTWEVCIKDPMNELRIDYDSLQDSSEYYSACMALVQGVFSAKGMDQLYSVYMDPQFEMLNDTYDIQPGMVIFKILVKREHVVKDLSRELLSIPDNNSFEQNAINHEHIHSLKLDSGIISPTPPTMINNKYLPLDFCYDLIPNSISFDKGCYIGQELTTRMYTTNKIKKRLVPFDIVFGGSGTGKKLLSEFVTAQRNANDFIALDIFTDNPLVQERQAAYNPFASDNNSPVKNSNAKKRIRPVGKIIYIGYDFLNNGATTLRAIGLLNMDYIAEQYGLSETLNKDSDGPVSDRFFYIKYPSKQEKEEEKEEKNKSESGSVNKLPLSLKPPYWLSSFVN